MEEEEEEEVEEEEEEEEGIFKALVNKPQPTKKCTIRRGRGLKGMHVNACAAHCTGLIE